MSWSCDTQYDIQRRPSQYSAPLAGVSTSWIARSAVLVLRTSVTDWPSHRLREMKCHYGITAKYRAAEHADKSLTNGYCAITHCVSADVCQWEPKNIGSVQPQAFDELRLLAPSCVHTGYSAAGTRDAATCLATKEPVGHLPLYRWSNLHVAWK